MLIAEFARRRGVVAQVVEVVAFIVAEAQRPRQRGEHLHGRSRAPRLLQARVVVGRHAREHGHLVPAQTGRAAADPRRQPDIRGRQLFAAPAQEICQFGSVHITTVPQYVEASQGSAIPR